VNAPDVEDNGMARYWIFIPGNGLWLVPPGADPDQYAVERGAATLFSGPTVKLRRPIRRYRPDGIEDL
jgi:hypothetical protein